MAGSQKDLSHVLWIGGSPCAGKSTIAHTIARTHVFVGYFLDPMARNHVRRRLEKGDAAMEAFVKMNVDQRWAARSIDTLFEEVLESWPVEFELAVEDLRALPDDWFIVAEGNFFPQNVLPYLSSLNQAFWLVPTANFVEQIRRKREAEQTARRERQGITHDNTSAEKRLSNLIARDIRIAEYVRQEAIRLGVAYLDVDGSLSLEETTTRVAEHFSPWITEMLKRLNLF
ncbi:MAG: hypothetical protein J0I20_32415 [Chloroflexi bacterium]|nr:hypothetical protein [Chloroflexota bacterium]OJV91975.1 MAG: hypothetical protein BGO39_12770 [Chloroflexi bacterium 54-19]